MSSTPMQRFKPQDAQSRLAQWTQNVQLRQWIEEQVRLLGPESVHLCDGTVSATRIRKPHF